MFQWYDRGFFKGFIATTGSKPLDPQERTDNILKKGRRKGEHQIH